MGFKFKKLNIDETKQALIAPSVNLRIIPGIDGEPGAVVLFYCRLCCKVLCYFRSMSDEVGEVGLFFYFVNACFIYFFLFCCLQCTFLILSLERAQLVEYAMEGEVTEAWEGPAALSLFPHARAPQASLPVHKVHPGKHIVGNLVLPYGKVIWNYLDVKNLKNLDSGKDVGLLTPREILSTGVMPVMSPSFPKSHGSLIDREYVVAKVPLDDPDVLLRHLPAELELLHNELWIEMVHTLGSGFGDYNKATVYIPCRDPKSGQSMKFSLISLVDNGAPLTAGRERYGQPYKFGQPKIEVVKDTLVATIGYGEIKDILRWLFFFSMVV